MAHAVDNQLTHDWPRTAQHIAGASIIGVHILLPLEQIIALVVQPAKAVCRPTLIALGCVVVDHIEQHFDAGAMERINCGAEFLVDLGGRGIGVVGRKEVQCHVAPVIAFLRVVLVNGQQFDHSDAKVEQVGNLLDQASEGAALTWIDSRQGAGGEAFDV